MTERYQQGRLEATGGGALAAIAAESVSAYRAAMDVHALHEGAAAAFRLVSAANKFIAETQPWALAKDPAQADRLNGVLSDTAEAVRIAAVLLPPVMPSSAAEILRRLGDDRPLADRRLDTDAAWRASGEKQILNAGALWPRIEETRESCNVTDETQKPRRRAGSAGEAPAPSHLPHPLHLPHPSHPRHPPAPALITIDDFMKVELKIAKVLEAERMPKSKKLLKLKVDAGEAEPRTILAGIAESYEPEAMVGKIDRDRRQPRAAQDDGHRVERHGAGRQPRRRRGDGVERRARAARHAGALKSDREVTRLASPTRHDR